VTVALMVAGALAVFVAWRTVVAERATVWVAMSATLGVLAVLSLATRRVVVSGRLSIAEAVGTGLAVGVVLYGATVAFVVAVRRWPRFDRHVAEIYDQRKGLSLPAALLLAAGVFAPGEEVFWRGLFQWRASTGLGWVGGAVLTWAVYVLANGGSASLPIFAAAVVSGAVWGALALWTHGIAASLCCHAVWTALMLLRPPPRRERAEAPASARGGAGPS
jgi:uncharacterized protein